ncbi:MAG: hypothetical protein GX654_02430 [Desulfatiglans sp.]|nr:hypothetical protein [Desulfatiglans sp.]
MPRMLSKPAIRLLEGSIENLSLCIEYINRPQRIPLHDQMSSLTVSTGLLGISIELVASAILVQTYGEKYLQLPSGYYKPAANIIDEMKQLLKNPIPKIDFLVQGIHDKSKHFQMLHEKLTELQFMLKIRAAAVHAARAPSKDIIIIYINKLLKLFNLLSQSEKFSSYLMYLPQIQIDIKNINVVIDDLIYQVNNSKDKSDFAAGILSLFLVLPEIPEYQPDWLSSIERVSVAPKEYCQWSLKSEPFSVVKTEPLYISI